MAGHGRKSHILAKVMLEAIYLDLNLCSATFCMISNQFVSDSTSSHQLNRHNSSLQRLLKAVREIMGVKVPSVYEMLRNVLLHICGPEWKRF